MIYSYIKSHNDKKNLIYFYIYNMIDMAGPVWIDNKPTGFGVKLLVDYLLNVKKNKKHDQFI